MTLDAKLKKFPFLETERLHRAAVVCHRNADADAYLSAFALSKLIRIKSPGCKVDIVTPGGMTTLTQKLSARFPHHTVEQSAETYDLYVAVDVGDEELLEGWLERFRGNEGVKVLVDHHPLKDMAPYDIVIVDDQATSAAEVVFGIFQELGASVDQETAQALLEGIMFDSAHLAIVSPRGLRFVVELMDAGADLALGRKELRTEPDLGEVLAKLKGAQRLKIYKAGKWVIASSRVGSFQAHVARSLVYLGADLAVVFGESEGETRVSLRSTQRFMDGTGLHLGVAVAEPVSRKLGGHGGGHATAASFTSSLSEDETVDATMKNLGELLGELRELG